MFFCQNSRSQWIHPMYFVMFFVRTRYHNGSTHPLYFIMIFYPELNISMDPSNVPFDVCFDSYISMDPFNVLFNVWLDLAQYIFGSKTLCTLKLDFTKTQKWKIKCLMPRLKISKACIFSQSLCSPGHVSSRAKPIHPHHSAIENQWLYRPEQIPLWSRKRFQDSHKLSSYQTCINIFFANKTGFHNSNAE